MKPSILFLALIASAFASDSGIPENVEFAPCPDDISGCAVIHTRPKVVTGVLGSEPAVTYTLIIVTRDATVKVTEGIKSREMAEEAKSLAETGRSVAENNAIYEENRKRAEKEQAEWDSKNPGQIRTFFSSSIATWSIPSPFDVKYARIFEERTK